MEEGRGHPTEEIIAKSFRFMDTKLRNKCYICVP